MNTCGDCIYYLGYPWGYVEVPDGWLVADIPASCDAECHCGHPFCWPGWKEILHPGVEILSGPVLDSFAGWIALVGIPPDAQDLPEWIKARASKPENFIDPE